MAKRKLESFPPFPPMAAGDFFWEGRDTLRAWKGYQSRQGSYGARSSSKPSDGAVLLNVAYLGDAEETTRPAPAQIAAYEFLKKNQSKLAAKVLAAIFKAYPKLRKEHNQFLTFDDGEPIPGAVAMPPLKSASELKKLIGLGTVHILNIAKGGHAYVGFEFGCEWDQEHGFGVMTHKLRIVEVGQGDSSFDERIAEEDGGKQLK